MELDSILLDEGTSKVKMKESCQWFEFVILFGLFARRIPCTIIFEISLNVPSISLYLQMSLPAAH